MAYDENEQEIQEAFEEYQKRREVETKPSPKNILANVPRGALILLFAGALILFYLVFIRKSIESSAFIWFIVIGAIFIILMSVQEDVEKKRLIPEDQLKAVLYTKLKEKQRVSPSEIPMGRIEILLPSKLKKIEGKPIKYIFSFKVSKPSGLETYFTCEMDPYTAYIMGFERRPAGFRGTEVTDVRFIRKKEDVWQDKYFGKKG